MGTGTNRRREMVMRAIAGLLALALVAVAGPLDADNRSRKRMDATVLKAMLEVLKSPQAQLAELVRQLQATPRAMPPNQYELRAPALAGLDVIEVVLAADDDVHAPIRQATVILKPDAGLKVRDLESVLGLAQIEEDAGKPRPARLVSFPRIQGERGLEIGITARIERPASRESQVRSMQFVRSPPQQAR